MDVRLVGITASLPTRLEESDRTCRLLNVDVENRRAMIGAVDDGRYDEQPETAQQIVYLKLHSKEFQGSSNGLALVLADKLVRFAPIGPERKIIATGCIVDNGHGAVAAVDGFEAKARHVLAQLDDPASGVVLFVVAAQNWEHASPELKQAVAASIDSGQLRLMPVTHVSELAPLWEATPVSAPSRWRGRAGIAAGVALVVLGITAAVVRSNSELRQCETALRALEQSQSSEAVGAAVHLCIAAAKAQPNDGRAQFLLGQAHSINGSELAAEEAWRKAAILHDPDGMATMGRLLRIEKRGAAADLEAVDWLTRAIDQGQSAANEDLGWMYFDGRGDLPRDPTRAEALWRAAGPTH